ncbi:MAG TPA: heavy metal translocating P-type ATPase, partial [Coleofasciculaceae cyanobacterium]
MTQTPAFKTQHMQVGGMDCPSCAIKIESNLQKLPGVAEASVSVATGRLSVSYDPQQVDEQAVEDRLTAMGYTILRLASNSSEDQGSHEHNRGHDHGHAHGHDHGHNHGHDHSHQHNHAAGDAGFSLKQELPSVVLVITLLILGIVFEQPLHNTPYHLGEFAIFVPAYLLSGWSVLQTAGRNILRGQVFDETFLMSVATIGAIAIHKLPEAVTVMLFYKIGELFQEAAVQRSRRSIQSLLDIRPDSANLKTDAGIQVVSPENVRVGDLILVKPGEKIPLDGKILTGQSLVDTSALTGEAVPRSVKPGEPVLAGMINQSGVLMVQVTKRLSESSIARILELVENATSRKAKTEKFITRFAQRYTPIVVGLSLAVALLPPLLIPGATHAEWVYRALTLLVISCPCGLVISIPLGYFGGVGGAAKRGILVKGSTFLDTLADVKTVVFDKTGTLTQGNFKVTRIVTRNGFQSQEVLQWAAIAELQSNHPIAQSIRQAYGQPSHELEVTSYTEIAGHGVQAVVGSQTVLAGNDRLLHRENIEHDTCQVVGTIVHVAVDGVYAGYLEIADELKADAVQAIQSLKHLGVHDLIMLTGDSQAVAERIARSLDLTSYQAELLPEDKVTALEVILRRKNPKDKVIFVGDGINDAPVIALADVGMAMGGLGSDAAIETADVVIMTDAPSKVAEAILLGRK